MSASQLIIATGKTSSELLRMGLSDFSEADMLVRPVPTANHAAWQLSHTLTSSMGMLTAFGVDIAPQLPPKVLAVKKEHAASNDPAAFATKDEMLNGYDAVLAALKDAVLKLDDAALTKPSPEKMVNFAPTLGDLALLTSLHMTMHFGQIQVIRRALGKPVLF